MLTAIVVALGKFKERILYFLQVMINDIKVFHRIIETLLEMDENFER